MMNVRSMSHSWIIYIFLMLSVPHKSGCTGGFLSIITCVARCNDDVEVFNDESAGDLKASLSFLPITTIAGLSPGIASCRAAFHSLCSMK